MAWTTPKTWADGNLVTAADLNEQLRDNSDYLKTAADQGYRILTTAQRDALTGLLTGTMIYNSTIGVQQVWNGTEWTTPFPYLYSTQTIALDFGTQTADINWPAGFRNVIVETDVVNPGTSPGLTWRFLNGATLLNASAYNTWGTLLQTTYGTTNITSTQVGFYDGGRFTKAAFQIPPASISTFPTFEIRNLAGNGITAGWYAVNVSPTGMRLTMSGGGSANITLRCRVLVQS